MCPQANLYTFMGDHWLVTLIIVLALANLALRPIGTLLYALAYRAMGKL